MNSEVPLSSTPKARIVNIYSTGYTYGGSQERPLNEELLLGALSNYYDLYRVQLPRLLPEDFLTAPDGSLSVELGAEVSGAHGVELDAMLFALPSNQVILAILVDFDCDLRDLRPIVGVLEQGIQGGLLLNGEPLEAALRAQLNSVPKMALEGGSESDGGTALLPERHQLVFIRRENESEDVPSADMVHTIVYRTTPPLTEEFARPKTPEQLNQVRVVRTASGPRSDTLNWRQLLRLDEPLRSEQEKEYRKVTLGVVTPYVSLLFGHQAYIEESVLLSSVHAVGTASKFRQIWSDTYEQVQLFRRTKQEQEPGRQTRASLEELADRLGNLEFDLTFSVEFPQLRIESFQAALYDAMDLSTQAKTLSTMFTQVANSVRSEITAITVREQQINEGRHRWNAFAGGILSLFGVSVGFVIAFLGVNTTEVPSGNLAVSMWSPTFADVYLVAGLFAVIPVFFIAFPYLREWVANAPNRRPLWAGVFGLSLGLALLLCAIVIDDIARRHEIFDAIIKSFAVLAFTVGLSLAGLYVWRRLVRRRRTARRFFAGFAFLSALAIAAVWYSLSFDLGSAGIVVTVVSAAGSAVATLVAGIAAVISVRRLTAAPKERPGTAARDHHAGTGRPVS
jgi:hypothetical protein